MFFTDQIWFGYILGGFSQKHLVTLLGAIFDRT
jgi:hypothetical protein